MRFSTLVSGLSDIATAMTQQLVFMKLSDKINFNYFTTNCNQLYDKIYYFYGVNKYECWGITF